MIADCLNRNLLYHAFALLRGLVTGPQSEPQWSDRLQSIEQNYDYLTQYFISGKNDPERSVIIRQMTVETYRLLDEITTAQARQQMSGTRLQMEERAHNLIQQQLITPDAENVDEDFAALKVILYTFWLYPNWHEVQNLWDIILKEQNEEQLHMAVAGILLSCFDHFSEKKMQVLLENILLFTDKVQNRIIVGMLLLLKQYGTRLHLYPEFLHQLTILQQDSDLHHKLMLAYRFILETCLVPKVDKVMQSMQSDILPTINKQEKEQTIILNMDELEDGHPAWAPELQQSLHKHIDAMTHLHQQGADFTYSSTKTLLHDVFFQQDIANWFLSFNPKNPQTGIDFTSESGAVVQKIININIESCDVDKYATCLMYKHIKGHVTASLPDVVQEMGNVNVLEMLSADERVRFGMKNEVRNWYRFLLHNPWGYANQFKNVDDFCTSRLPELLQLSDAEYILLADRCLALERYEAVNALFLAIEHPTAELYQKWGYAQQKAGDEVSALHHFEQAISMQPDDHWSMLHAAQCLRTLHDYASALQYYDQLLEANPNKKSYLLGKAHCLIDNNQAEEALQLFFQLDLLYPEQLPIQRGLAWCAFICNRQEIAERYLEQLAFADTANAADCLNYAHLLFCQQQRENAMHFYKLAQQKSKKVQDFFDMFREDRAVLRKKGITQEELRLLEDILLRTMQIAKN